LKCVWRCEGIIAAAALYLYTKRRHAHRQGNEQLKALAERPICCVSNGVGLARSEGVWKTVFLFALQVRFWEGREVPGDGDGWKTMSKRRSTWTSATVVTLRIMRLRSSQRAELVELVAVMSW
jgi:hypothetical protein